MSSQRRSDENSDPDEELNVKNIKAEVNSSKPLLPSNETFSNKKKLSSFERKDKARFLNSGMRKGSLLKYFVKQNPEEMNQPANDSGPSTRNRSASSCSTTEKPNQSTNGYNTTDNGAGESNSQTSQDSDLVFLGEVPKPQVSAPIIEVNSESEDGDSVSPEEFEADSPQVSDYSEENYEVAHPVPVDIESVISTLDDDELSGEDKIARWQRQNKRILHENEHKTASDGCTEFQPPPAKTSKLELVITGKEMQSQDEHTPEKSQEETSTPPLRIINVYTLSSKNDATPSTSTASTDSRKSGERAKKSILIHKEYNNTALAPLMEKRNWKKIMMIIRKDLESYRLPSATYVSQLIRKAILCEESRVSKDVQSESIELLEELIKSYPPQNGNGKDPSVRYYKEILDNVFDDNESKGRPRSEKGNTLNIFLPEIHKRLEMGKNALQLLILVTDLVYNQYEVYEQEEGVIVKPPLFQYFLEDKNGNFVYDQHCQNIINNCLEAESEEVFCIYVKWITLIARKLGKFSFKHKEYKHMIDHFAELCKDENDMGLRLMMNIRYVPFCKLVCEKIFEIMLTVVRVSTKDRSKISQKERLAYLNELSNTLFILPAVKIVTDQVEEVCKVHSSLTFIQTRAESIENGESNGDNQESVRKKNVKGETRLHILCRPATDIHKDPLPDIEKHLKSYPGDVNAKDNFGNTPLHDCARNNKGNIIMKLMELCGKEEVDSIDFLARNKSLETPMHLAATYCDWRTTELLMYFAESCGVLEEVLITPNKNGKLPFQLAPSNSPIKKKITPEGYVMEEMLVHRGLTLDETSIDTLEENFELRKILAWWSRYCIKNA